ncbi:hypothetical protein ACM66B_004243 [Microbotryomycetes sp. NB124-2]
MNTLTAVSRWFSSRPPVNALGDPSSQQQQHHHSTAQATDTTTRTTTTISSDDVATGDLVSTRLNDDEKQAAAMTTTDDDGTASATETAAHGDDALDTTLFLSATRSSLPTRVSLTTTSATCSSSSSPPPYSAHDRVNHQQQHAPVVQDEENGKNEWTTAVTHSSTEPTKQVSDDPLSVTEKTAEPVTTSSSNEDDLQKVTSESDEEGERRLALKRKRHQRSRRETLTKSWPIRVSVSIYVLLRRLLALLGLPYPPRLAATTTAPLLAAPVPASVNATTTTVNDADGDDDDASPDELLVSLRNSTRQLDQGDDDSNSKQLALKTQSTATVTHKLRRTAFFLKKATPSSRSASPLATSSATATAQAPISIPRPPRMTPKTLVLDLDETLIHSTSRPYAPSKRNAGLKVRVVEVVLDGRSTVYTVYKRPWVDFFLRKVSTWYTVIIFTASLPEYADPVIDWLDGGDGSGGMVAGRLFRSDCVHANGAYVKDLTVVEQDLSRVCLVDNSPVSYAINQANGIPIEGWINDPNDECLLDLLPMLDSLRFTNDVRRVLGLRGFR